MARFRHDQHLAATFQLAIAMMAVIVLSATSAYAQTFQVIHSFTGADGGNPYAGLTLDQSGNLYGTTEFGGNSCGDSWGCGTVFKLNHHGSSWTLSQLYKFNATNDGQHPQGRVVFGPDGIPYGTTSAGGSNGDGIVFSLQPAATVCRSVSCPWTKTTLFSFSFDAGTDPLGDLTFDTAGNIYGTTYLGGLSQGCNAQGCGVVYELTPAGGIWTESVLYAFTGVDDGGYPESGVIFDQAGNLYGTAPYGHGTGQYGVVFELSPAGAGWTQSVLYSFQNSSNGAQPIGGLIFDPAGNLYGTAAAGGLFNGGTAYELLSSSGYSTLNLVYSLPADGELGGPLAKLARDSAGNLYGTTTGGGAYGGGSVFELSPSNGSWIYTDLYDFNCSSDGCAPYGGLVMDANGNLYGTAFVGGSTGATCQYNEECGVVFEITP